MKALVISRTVEKSIVRSAPFRFRTLHGFEKGRNDLRGEQMFTLDRLVQIQMPYFAFIAQADATIAALDRELP
jgi:hypothetical protein